MAPTPEDTVQLTTATVPVVDNPDGPQDEHDGARFDTVFMVIIFFLLIGAIVYWLINRKSQKQPVEEGAEEPVAVETEQLKQEEN